MEATVRGLTHLRNVSSSRLSKAEWLHSMSGMSGFFEEVKRRKVYRVAVAYIVAAGGIIQLASAAFPAWELPNWSLRLVISLLLIGFPIALIFAWVFDITPEGIRTTEPVANIPSRHRGRRNIALLVAAGIIISAVAGFLLLPRMSSAHKMEKSIAVLPFENLSDDKENAYFADGIQDDILTNLSKIGDLKVVSRTSVLAYRNKPGSVREIGKALGVSAILEGTVRKSGNRVRINVQLINAENDEHLWAQEYDRDLTDVFAIQTDLSQKIADELQAKLSPREMAQMTRKPTENGEAYLAFVEARDLQTHVEDVGKLKQAERLYERALQLDPNFALAAANYSQLESWIGHTFEPNQTRRDQAHALANRALELQPDLPEAHLALGFFYYYGANDFDAAQREFQIARAGLPNASDVYLALGAIARRKGQWAESDASLQKASILNPKDTWSLQNLAMNYEMERDFTNAQKTIDRALEIDPRSYALWELKAKIAIEAKGDFSAAEQALIAIEGLPESNEKTYLVGAARGSVRFLQRRYAEVLGATNNLPSETSLEKLSVLPSHYLMRGLAAKALHDEATARDAFEKGKAVAKNRLESVPIDPDARILLAATHACLGEKEEALAETQRAIETLPVSKDAFHGPDILTAAAEIYAALGENDRAFATLDQLARIPSPLSAAKLNLDPSWDRIRNDPRFAETVTKFSAKI